MKTYSTQKERILIPLLVTSLLLALLVQAVFSMRIKSPTFDEPIHLTAGYIYLTDKNFDFKNDHPPLIRQIVALPLLLFDLKPSKYTDQWLKQVSMVFGRHFLFSPGNNVDRIIFFSRIPIVFISMLLGYYVFAWARELYGNYAGLLSLFLYVFSPNILAHSRLVTADLGSTCFISIACFYFWRYLDKPSFLRLFFAGTSLGLALVSKYSALTLLIIFPILFAAKLLSTDKKKDPKKQLFFSNRRDVLLDPKPSNNGIDRSGCYFHHLPPKN
jgi:predicted membrane-bound dolichyl-phosphate-mannose-protein mannosyltransferase